MKPARKLNRRSFLGQVAGGAIGLGALGLVGSSRAGAQTGPYTGVTDNDTGSYADNAGHGRGPGGNASGQPVRQTGVTDRDPTDPSGGGRGTATGYSDSDSGSNADPSGQGRRREYQTGRTDSDSYDRTGEGRGPVQGYERPSQHRPDGTCVVPTGHTDSDSGQTRDPSGYGNNGAPGSNYCYRPGN